LHVDHLVALSGLSIARPPTTNPWNSPPSQATTQPSTNFSPLSESQTTLISALVAEVKSLKSTVLSQNTTIDNNKSNITIQLTAQSAKIQTIQMSLDDSVAFMARENIKQSVKINEITSQVKSQETTIESINDRIDNISKQVSPLNEAVQAGGLAALIQQTVLACLRQTQHQTPTPQEPMEEDFSHTPRQLFDLALATTDTEEPITSGQKQKIPPSPFSRKGQSTPVRARLEYTASASSRSTDDL
jgi:chromosome segregation ATPase